jgi:NADH-quinone oxidoreductase subunit E
MEYVANMLGMAYIRVYEIATFYTMFQLSPIGKKAHVQLCGTTPCMLRGAEDLKNVLMRRISPEPHHLSAQGDFSWEEVECLGACVNAPMIQIWKDTYEDLTPEALERILDEIAAGRKPRPGPQNGRHFTAPAGGPTTLTDPSLYDGSVEKREPSGPAGSESTPPSRAAKPDSSSEETAPGLKTPSPEKSGEAEASRAKMRERAEATAQPEKTPSRVAKATKANETDTAKRPPTRAVEGSNPPIGNKPES